MKRLLTHMDKKRQKRMYTYSCSKSKHEPPDLFRSTIYLKRFDYNAWKYQIYSHRLQSPAFLRSDDPCLHKHRPHCHHYKIFRKLLNKSLHNDHILFCIF